MKKKALKTHTFNGRKYIIDVDFLDGWCDQFKLKHRLQILADLKTKDGLITAIHEALHAENWCKSEKVIDKVSTEIGNFLWRLGFRLKVK